MLDKILSIGASFDWISPVASVVGDMMNGPSHTFLVPYDSSPLSGREIAWMLSKRGIKSWGHMVVSGTFMISVRLSQARWAQHLLDEAGVPIDNPVAEPSRPVRARRGQSTRHGRSRQRGQLEDIADAVKEILDTPLF